MKPVELNAKKRRKKAAQVLRHRLHQQFVPVAVANVARPTTPLNLVLQLRHKQEQLVRELWEVDRNLRELGKLHSKEPRTYRPVLERQKRRPQNKAI